MDRNSKEGYNLFCSHFKHLKSHWKHYNEFRLNEHPAVASRFRCIKIFDCNVNQFGYNKHPLSLSSFFYIFYSL